MLELPPGERGLGDYLRLPLAIFRDPQLLNPDLLRSVWGSTFVTVWFDGHRYFLPRQSRAVAGSPASPCCSRCSRRRPSPRASPAAAPGCGRPGAADLPLLLLTALTLAGYASTPGAIRGSRW